MERVTAFMPMTHVPEIGSEIRYQKNLVPKCMPDALETGTGFLVSVFGANFWHVRQYM